ncbi:MAG TPA: hypothetical protein VK612_08810 [Pyrinomonadaceae bacterium]|nr:hypothetical protein [Pyrinomonadaceae bacterium]
MRYTKRFGIILAAIVFLSAIVFVAETSAQTRNSIRAGGGSSRPTVNRRVYYRRPFYRSRFYDPFYDPYFYDPYLSVQREKYYKEKAVRDAKREIAIHEEKYSRDGVITEKERKQMIDDKGDHAKAVRSLQKFNADY